MELIDDSNKSNKILEFAEGHPYVLLAVISVLIILVIIMFLGSCGYNIPMVGCKKGKKKKKEIIDDEDEIDELITSIHNKQKRKTRPQEE